MDQPTATGPVPMHPDTAQGQYALTAAGHAALAATSALPPFWC